MTFPTVPKKVRDAIYKGSAIEILAIANVEIPAHLSEILKGRTKSLYFTVDPEFAEYVAELDSDHLKISDTKWFGEPMKKIKIVEDNDRFHDTLLFYWDRLPIMRFDSELLNRYLRAFLTACVAENSTRENKIIYPTPNIGISYAISSRLEEKNIPHITAQYPGVDEDTPIMRSIWFYNPRRIKRYVDEQIWERTDSSLKSWRLEEAKEIRDRFMARANKNRKIVLEDVQTKIFYRPLRVRRPHLARGGKKSYRKRKKEEEWRNRKMMDAMADRRT